MKPFHIRIAILVVLGIVAMVSARPLMTQYMLMQENEKAKKITPAPDYVPPINPGGAGASATNAADVEQPSDDPTGVPATGSETEKPTEGDK